ncbi:MAG: glycosyltransferase [Actinomycetota bacterium]
MKRILLLIKGLGRGGAEQLLASAAPLLDQTRFGYEVAYLLPWKNALAGDLQRAGLRVECLSGGEGVAWAGRLRSLVRRRGIDLVHVHSPYPAIGARLIFGRTGPRVVYTEHNIWARYHLATYWANMITFPRNDHVFAVSDHVRASIGYPAPLRWLSMPPVETLYHGIDPEAVSAWFAHDGIRRELGVPEDAPVVGTIANFKVHKAHDVLLRAAAEVRLTVPDVRFVLVGTGPLEDDVRRHARAMGLDGTVVFAGFRDDAPKVAGTFDVFALPSTYEGLSIALLEAMALGKPPVVTNVGGLPEVVENDRDGVVVPPGDPGALADGILSLLTNREKRLRLGEGARSRAMEFDIRKAVRRMEEVYKGLLA